MITYLTCCGLGLLSVSLLRSLGTSTKSSSGLEQGLLVSGPDLVSQAVLSGAGSVPGDAGNSTGSGFGLSLGPCRKGWLKNSSKGILSLALRLKSPIRRFDNSGEVPGGILKSIRVDELARDSPVFPCTLYKIIPSTYFGPKLAFFS